MGFLKILNLFLTGLLRNKSSDIWSSYTEYYFGRSPGWAGDPAGCGHSKLARVRAYWVAAD